MADGWWVGRLEQNNRYVLPLLSLETWRELEGIWYLFLKISSSKPKSIGCGKGQQNEELTVCLFSEHLRPRE